MLNQFDFHFICVLLFSISDKFYIFIADSSSKSCRFRALDPVEVKNTSMGGERRSAHSETWARNTFDEWRRFRGYSLEKTIGELSEEEDIRGFVEMLVDFLLQVSKQDGTLYEPGS